MNSSNSRKERFPEPRDPLLAITNIVLWYGAYRGIPFTKIHQITIGQLLTEAVAYLEETSSSLRSDAPQSENPGTPPDLRVESRNPSPDAKNLEKQGTTEPRKEK